MIRALCSLILLLIVSGCGEGVSPNDTLNSSDASAESESSANTGDADFDLPLPGKDLPLPEDLPDDVPIYPGSRVIHKDDSETGRRNAYRMEMILRAGDPLEKVRQFYKIKIDEFEWELEKESPNSFSGKKGDRTLFVYLVEPAAHPGATSVNVTYTHPEKKPDQ